MLYILLAHMLNYFNPLAIVSKYRFNVYLYQGRRKRGGAGGAWAPLIISICIRQSKTLRLEKCETNSDLLKKMKEPRLALSTLLAHMLQAIFDSLLSSNQIKSFPNF